MWKYKKKNMFLLSNDKNKNKNKNKKNKNVYFRQVLYNS